MKNLLYLLFTALLLSSCIEIVVKDPIEEAFFNRDKGIRHTNEFIIDPSIEETLLKMKNKVAENKAFSPIYEAAKTIPQKISPLLDKIKELRAAITNDGGFYLYTGEYHDKDFATRKAEYSAVGYTNFVETDDRKLEAKPVNKKDYNITQRILITEGKGEELKDTINQTRTELLKVIDELTSTKMEGVEFDPTEIESLKADLVLEEQNDEMAKENGKDSWAAHVFSYMPIASCYPLLRKYENDGKNAAAQIVNYLAKKMGVE